MKDTQPDCGLIATAGNEGAGRGRRVPMGGMQRVGAERGRKATEGKKAGEVWWKNKNGAERGALNKENRGPSVLSASSILGTCQGDSYKGFT